MERLKFCYNMKLHFSSPINNHCYTLKCIPAQNERQKIFDLSVCVEPGAGFRSERDAFGNLILYGKAEASHRIFQVTMEGLAEIETGVLEREGRQKAVYCYSSKYTRPGKKIKEFYWENRAKNEENDMEKSIHYMNCLFGQFQYEKGCTDVSTTAEEAMELRKGVCQDYAHILLTLLHLEKIPARYVVGMMQGEGCSHAWVEFLYRGKWVGIDPTNHQMVKEGYIKISHGRDYGDCIINRGYFYGNARQEQEILVKVFPE